MKTKHILTAMVLPTMFAACTAEEIVENNNVAANVNRTQVEAVTFAANGDVESRLVWDDETGKFAWEDTDKFLLFPADDGTTVNESTSTTTVYPGGRFAVGTTLVTGYEYEKGEDGTYTTKAAQMGEGLWWGYAPSFEKKARGLVGYEISTSQDADYYKSEAAQAFITPMYEISSLNYNNKLPLDMMNFYSTVIIPLTNNTKEDMTLNQIVLELQGDDYFVTKGLINIGAMADFIVAYDGEKWDDWKNLDDDEDNDRKAGKLLEDMRKTYLVKEYDKAEDGEKSQVIMLNLKGDVLEAGETKEYRMLVPATSKKVSFNIIVLAKEGYKEITAASQSNYMYNTNIYHNGEKAAFGRKDGVAKAYSIKNLVDAESNRYYVASKEELLDKIYEVNGTFTAVKVGTWNIDSEIAKAIEESDSYVIFEGDYTVADEVASRAAEEEDKGIELSKVAFKNEVTVLEGNKVTFVESTIGENELMKDAKLIVAEGAEVVIEDGIFAGEIENEGSLTVEATVPTTYKKYTNEDDTTGTDTETIKNITSTGAVTLKGYDHKVTLNGGSLTYTAADINTTAGVDDMNVSKLTLAATLANNITINVGEQVIWTVEETKKAQVVTYSNGAVSKKAKIVNNGTIVTSKNGTGLAVYDLENAGDIVGADGIATHVEVYGEAENTGDILTDYWYVRENAVLKNSGVVDCKTMGQNNGTVVCVTRDSEIKVTEGTGRINNTIGSNLELAQTAKTSQTIFYEMTDDFSIKDFATLRFDLWSINTLSVQAEFTYEDDADASVNAAAYTQLSNLTAMEFENGSSLYVPAGNGVTMNKVGIYTSKVRISGNVTMYGWSATNSGINFEKANTVSMTKGSKLTIKKVQLSGSEVTVKAPTLLSTEYDTEAEQKSNSAKLILEDNVSCESFTIKAASSEAEEAKTTFVTSYANVGAKTVYTEGLTKTGLIVTAASN